MDSKDTQIEGLAYLAARYGLAWNATHGNLPALLADPELLAFIPAVKALQEEVADLKQGIANEQGAWNAANKERLQLRAPNAAQAEQLENLRGGVQLAVDYLEPRVGPQVGSHGATVVLPKLRALLQSSTPAESQLAGGEAVAWEYRFNYGENSSITGWSAWEKLEPRSPRETVESRVSEIQAYIDQGLGYELRALYTAPAINQQVPPGYALVPIEPTADMLTAAWNVEQSGRCPDEEREVWKAMLAASPSAPIAEGDEQTVFGPNGTAITNFQESKRGEEEHYCRGIMDSRCQYLSGCGAICNKCGRQHDGVHFADGSPQYKANPKASAESGG